jgi:hypothetical protein
MISEQPRILDCQQRSVCSCKRLEYLVDEEGRKRSNSLLGNVSVLVLAHF